jgi:hypothetical protein
LDLINENPDELYRSKLFVCADGTLRLEGSIRGKGYGWISKSPYGQPGDLLWVRETFCEWMGMYQYRSDTTDNESIAPWKPSIHMPKDASRLWLMVEEIRVERLQDITEEDAIAEGIDRFYSDLFKEWRYRDYFDGKRRTKAFSKFPKMAKLTGFGSMPWPDWRDPLSSFNSLWISINGQASWDANPWVWVIRYRLLSKTGRPSMDVIEKNYLEVTGKEVPSV